METTTKFVNLSRFSKSVIIPWSRITSTLSRHSSHDTKTPQKIVNTTTPKEKKEEYDIASLFKKNYVPGIRHWDEIYAIRKAMKESAPHRNINNITDLVRFIQSIHSINGITDFLKKRAFRKQLAQQLFSQERQSILKPDLAAAHFVVHQGGSVKFAGSDVWIGKKGSKIELPSTYIPGYFVEAISAEGTNLFNEGLTNLCNLKRLTTLSLKGLKEIDDWSMDWISSEYHKTLNVLDISDCTGVTYRGLSCFYRFECLQKLIVKGIPDTPEFKLACIMLQDVMPELEIEGITLAIPEKIDSVKIEEVKNLSSQ